jgi:hypothetical protein
LLVTTLFSVRPLRDGSLLTHPIPNWHRFNAQPDARHGDEEARVQG